MTGTDRTTRSADRSALVVFGSGAVALGVRVDHDGEPTHLAPLLLRMLGAHGFDLAAVLGAHAEWVTLGSEPCPGAVGSGEVLVASVGIARASAGPARIGTVEVGAPAAYVYRVGADGTLRYGPRGGEAEVARW